MTILEVTQILEAMEAIPGFEAGRVHLASLETLRRAYNGCGPERWPQAWRDKLDEETQMYAPSILVHDLDFDESDGRDDTMHEANERFHRNNRRIFRHFYPFWTWRMLRPSYRLKRAKARIDMLALNAFTRDFMTWDAWQAMSARNYVYREARGDM